MGCELSWNLVGKLALMLFISWQDFEGYYSKPPSLLTAEFDSGDLASLTSQLDLALTIAEATDRILVFPEFLTLRHNASYSAVAPV